MLMRFHTQTAGVSLTAQQPLNNIVRTATEALAGVLGGTQSLHTNSYDEALALPTEEAVRIAMRTQQVIAHETGVTNTIDPLGGSYFVEALTDKMEEAAYDYFRRIDELGGMVEAIKQNYPQREIADASFQYQCEVDDGKRIVVGVNQYQHADERELEILRIDPALERKQIDRLQGVRAPARLRRGRGDAHRAQAGRVGRRQPDGAASRVRARPRERGRDHRGAPNGVRYVYRDTGLLEAPPRKVLHAQADRRRRSAVRVRRLRRERAAADDPPGHQGRDADGRARRQLLQAQVDDGLARARSCASSGARATRARSWSTTSRA